jgi:hypothetical protein
MTIPTIKAAAAALAEAKQDSETAAATLAEADDNRAQAASRIAALEADRSAIVAERSAGKLSPDHGSRLALIAADIDGLVEIRTEADAAVTPARVTAQSASSHVAMAQAALDRESDSESLRRFVEHAGKLDALMVATLREIAALTTRRGARATWFPSAGLALEIRRLDLQSGHVL